MTSNRKPGLLNSDPLVSFCCSSDEVLQLFVEELQIGQQVILRFITAVLVEVKRGEMIVVEEGRKQDPARGKRELAEQLNGDTQMAEGPDRQKGFLEGNIGCSMLRKFLFTTKSATKQS